MARINYKMLFEVRLLHEYYLSNSDGTGIFDSTVNKNDFLLDHFVKGMDSINKNLTYELPPFIQQYFNNFHLRLIPKYSGFAIFARVIKQQLTDGTIAYKPLVPLPAHANILVQLSVKNNFLSNVTNMRFNKAIPAAYYFTNEAIVSGKTYPVLSAETAPFDDTYLYEQGELYTNAQHKLCSFYVNGDTADFLPVKGSGFAGARDQLLVPIRFTYRFNVSENVTRAKFDLLDHNGQTVRSYEVNKEQSFQTVTLNFSNVANPQSASPTVNIITLPSATVSGEKVYTLHVTVNEAAQRSHQLIFVEDTDSFSSCWGMVNIKPSVENSDFNLYDSDQLIRYRKLSDGTIIAAPVFEVRFKSRVNFWRYINDRAAKLKEDSHPVFLTRSGNNLVSKVPRPASFVPLLFSNDSDNSLHYLPNPVADGEIKIEGRKVYSDIRVPASRMFPLDTS